MIKSGDNYNNKEKIIVQMSWRYRNALSNQMQNELINVLKNDKEFLKSVKENDKELYNNFEELLKCPNI